jgi:hypothetical protein
LCKIKQRKKQIKTQGWHLSISISVFKTRIKEKEKSYLTNTKSKLLGKKYCKTPEKHQQEKRN